MLCKYRFLLNIKEIGVIYLLTKKIIDYFIIKHIDI